MFNLQVYQKVLVLDLDYALDKKVEQDLWNVGFKQQIEALQAISKDKKVSVQVLNVQLSLLPNQLINYTVCKCRKLLASETFCPSFRHLPSQQDLFFTSCLTALIIVLYM